MSSESSWALVQLLSEPTRRLVFETVRAADGPISRDEVAQGAGINRRLAAFHLDLLAGAGLLTTDYARPPGRGGPGAGRPAKRYAAARRELGLSVPPRRYDVAARILARAIVEAPGADVAAQALSVADDEGQRIGELRRPGGRLSAPATMDAVAGVLSDLGYEPQRAGDRCLRLRNCPFRAVVEVNTDLVCGVNHHLVAGVLKGLRGQRAVRAETDGVPPDCCVTVRRR